MLEFASFPIGHSVLLRGQVDIYLHVCMIVCAHTCLCMLKVWMKLIPYAGVFRCEDHCSWVQK